jgi:hypothetical protein
MATILIVGHDQTGQTRLATSLRARGHSVFLRDWHGISSSTRGEISSEADVAIFDVTSLVGEEMELLRGFCLHDLGDRGTPLVLCFSRRYHGPRFELSIESLGARFVYA